MNNFIESSISGVKSISRWLTYAAAFFLLLLMTINIIDIIGAKWFNWTLPGMMDFSEELMVLLTILPLTFVHLERGQISITFLVERLSGKKLLFVNIFQYLLSIFVMGFWTWRSSVQLKMSVVNMQMKYGINFPTWPANLAITVSFGMLTFILILLFVQYLFSDKDKKSIV